MTLNDKEELEMLRASAVRFMTDPLEKAFFRLENLAEKPQTNRIDAIMPTSAFYVLADALIELKRRLDLNGKS